MPENKDLIERQHGVVAFDPGLLTQEQEQFYGRLLQVVDRNPKLAWGRDKSDDHNHDFVIIEDSIETTREFNLKAINLARLSTETMPPETTVTQDETLVTVRVKVWDKDGVSVMGAGGCSTKEGRTKRREYHDAVARAETRAMKRAVEAKIGTPFINMLIRELFGGYNVYTGDEKRASEARDVTQSGDRSESANEAAKEIMGSLFRMLAKCVKAGIMDNTERAEWWDRAQAHDKEPQRLENVRKELKELMDLRMQEG